MIYNGYKFKDQLSPCPFCGENKEAPPYMIKEKKKHHDEFHYSVQCSNCGAEPDFCVTTESEAISHWNKRASLSKTQDFINGFNSAKVNIKDMIDMLFLKEKNNECK